MEIARKSKLFSKIHISTDSDVVKNISSRYGIKTDFMRPKYLSDDRTGLMDVYSYVVNKYKKIGCVIINETELRHEMRNKSSSIKLLMAIR